MRTNRLRGPLVETDVHFWPGVIDMLTSLLMFFMLVSFVQHNVNPGSLAAEVARQKERRFSDVFDREFRAERERGEVEVRSDGNLLQLTFGEQILFSSGEYLLNSQGKALLRRLARVVRELDSSASAPLYDQIQIEGHTDDRNLWRSQYPRNNWELSTARALEVLTFLSERSDPRIDQARLSANGYADTRPVSTIRAKNRRIEIRIYFSGGEALLRKAKA